MADKITYTTRKESIVAAAKRYQGAPKQEKMRILLELVALAHGHRMHAIP